MNIFNAALTGSTQILGPIVDSAGNTGSLLSAIVYDESTGQTLWADSKDVVKGIADVAISISQSYSASAVVGEGNIIQIYQHSGNVDTLEIVTSSFTKSVNGATVNAAGNVTLESGDGLTTLANGGFSVGAGNGITVNANDVALATSTAGAGLTYTNGVLAVGAGNGITVNADDVEVDLGSVDHDSLNNFVANEHIDHSTVDITAGNGLTGGGDITATRTINVGSGTGITVNANDIAVDEANVNHDNLSGFVANEHIDHSAVSITAGDGLIGGGDITATRTLNIGAGTGITVNANDIAVDLTTVDHDGLSNFVANEHIDHSTVTITGGNGLTGGGDITAPRAVTLGTPTTLTTTSTDAVTANSHTHAIATTTTGTASTIVSTDASGEITAANFNTTSDRRLKSEINKIENGLETIKSFLPFNYIKGGKKESGWIAQEVQESIPHAVQENEEGFLTMTDRSVIAHMHKAILELSEKIEELQKKID